VRTVDRGVERSITDDRGAVRTGVEEEFDVAIGASQR
jgi:hypothetical protein